MNKNFLYLIVIIVLVVVVYFLFMGNVQAPQQNNLQGNVQQQNPTNNEPIPTHKTYEVTYTDSSYSPSELTIKVGDTVVFKNLSTKGMWTASALHPVHAVYSGTALQQHCPDPENNDFDQCKAGQPGEFWSFTFNKAGEWDYHNHVNTSHFGKIIVQ